VVDVHVRPAGPDSSPHDDVGIRAFVPHVSGTDELASTLASLRRERKLSTDACLIVWGLRASHQFLRLPRVNDADLEAAATREAHDEIAALETESTGSCVALTVGADVDVGTERRREVSLVTASEADVRRRLQPITDAGFVVHRVVTPAIALIAVARSCRDIEPGSTTALAAIGPSAACIAIVREDVLLLAREIPWEHTEVETEPVESRLASELRRSVLFFRQTFRSGVDRIVLCGDLAHLRSLTGPIGTALSVPVQILDSLTGIDADHLPEPADVFRGEIAALRLAIAVAAEPVTHANLLPPLIRKSREALDVLVRIAAVVVFALLLVAGWYGFHTARSAGNSEVAEIRRPPASRETKPASIDPAPAVPAADIEVSQPPRSPGESPTGRTLSNPTVVVSAILSSSERSLAVVNGRIVRIGDQIGPIRILDIGPRAIVVESPRGRRIVELRPPRQK